MRASCKARCSPREVLDELITSALAATSRDIPRRSVDARGVDESAGTRGHSVSHPTSGKLTARRAATSNFEDPVAAFFRPHRLYVKLRPALASTRGTGVIISCAQLGQPIDL